MIKTIAAIFLVLFLAGSASAAQIFYDIDEMPDQTIAGTFIDGAFIVSYSDSQPCPTLEGSFSGWGDLSGYTDLTATLSFTWHDENLNYFSETMIFTEGTRDTNELYPDLAKVSLDGAMVFENIEVGAYGTTDPSVYEYSLTDLSILEDNELTYLIEANKYSSARTDFIVDSVALTIEGNPSAVPVPSAVWLLGTGLLGLVGLRRKKVISK